VKSPSQHISLPGDYARPGLPCAGKGAKAQQRYHCEGKRSQGGRTVALRYLTFF